MEVVTYSYINYVLPVVLGLTALEWAYDAWTGGRRYHWLQTLTHFSTAVWAQIAGAVNLVLLVWVYAWVAERISIQQVFGAPEWPRYWPFPDLSAGFVHTLWAIPLLLGILVVVDFCQYWNHRLSHEWNWLWALHVTHHSSPEFNLAVAVRQGFLQEFVNWVFYLPLAVLGVPWQLFALVQVIQFTWVYLVHTQHVATLGWLDGVLNTPGHHRVHHGTNPQYLDKNYSSGLLIVWDRVFGTFEPEREAVVFGITTPVTTPDPWWVNVHHLYDIGVALRVATTWAQRWKIVWGTPSEFAEFQRAHGLKATTGNPEHPVANRRSGRSLGLIALTFVLCALPVLVWTEPAIQSHVLWSIPIALWAVASLSVVTWWASRSAASKVLG
jgi:sterol desaturase/sphingolipid hydroxylase (fatty acid hydroxylase superfamily)